MPAPAASLDFTVYLERLDSIFVNAVHPKCFLCGLYLQASDKKCVVLRGRDQIIRIEADCWDTFIIGIAFFNDNMPSMKVFGNEIQ